MIEFQSWITFFYLMAGTFLSSSGASILNQYIEREHDKKLLFLSDLKKETDNFFKTEMKKLGN